MASHVSTNDIFKIIFVPFFSKGVTLKPVLRSVKGSAEQAFFSVKPELASAGLVSGISERILQRVVKRTIV